MAASRSEADAAQAIAEIRPTIECEPTIEWMPLDLASFASVRAFVAQFKVGE